MKKSSLNTSEFVLIAFFTLLIVLITFTSYFQAFSFPRKYLKGGLTSVEITGAVKFPGIYKVYPGTLVKTVLKKAKLTIFADLKEIDCDQPVEKSKKLFVPRVEQVKVFLKGAVKEKVVFLKPGSSICSILKQITPKLEADLSVLNSLEKVKEGQIITVPFLPKRKKGREY